MKLRLRWWILLLLFSLLSCAFSLSAQTKKKTPRRRAARYAVPSYGNPSAQDKAEGENPEVRAVAVRALGRFNGSVVVV